MRKVVLFAVCSYGQGCLIFRIIYSGGCGNVGIFLQKSFLYYIEIF